MLHIFGSTRMHLIPYCSPLFFLLINVSSNDSYIPLICQNLPGQSTLRKKGHHELLLIQRKACFLVDRSYIRNDLRVVLLNQVLHLE